MKDQVTRQYAPVQADTQAAGLSDEILMEAYLEGSEPALGLLIRRYERELFSYLRRIVLDPELAEDVFQNTFLQLHVKRALYQTGRPVRPWLYTIATNQAIDAMRRHRRHQHPSLDAERDSGNEASCSLLETIPGKSSDPHGLAERNERRHRVRATVDRLADHLRVVVVLCYYQGMKYKDIAEVLGIPVGTVKSRLHAGIRRLGKEWERLGWTADD